MSKFKTGDELFYVNPFVFIIDKVLIEFIEEDGETGLTFFIDNVGAYLAEHDLFETLPEAQQYAMLRLNDFYAMKFREIAYSNPQLNLEED